MPAGLPHAVRTTRPTRMYCFYFSPRECPLDWRTPTSVVGADFDRAVIVRLEDASLTDAERKNTEAAMYDVLRPINVTTIAVPLG